MFKLQEQITFFHVNQEGKRLDIIMKTLILTLLLCAFALNTALLADPKGTLSLQPDCGTFYAGREHTLTIKAEGLTGECLRWNLRYAGKTLTSGQRQIPAGGEVKIPFAFPELNEGVVAETEFSCFTGKPALSTGCEAIEKEIKRRLYFFYPDPFVSRKESLKELKMGVWEPGEGEALSGFLELLDVPLKKVADLANFNGKVLFISDLDFDEFPGVSSTLLEMAGQGKKIIILPPFSGTFPQFAKKTDNVILSKNQAIPRFNRKFDADSWNGNSVSNGSMKLVFLDDGVALKRANNGSGFTYCELSIGEGGIILTEWDIVNGAKVSPTPVYLLKEMLLGAIH